MRIVEFYQAKEFLYQYIPDGVKEIFAAGFGLKRAKYFLRLLGEPQNKLRVVHVAGTSGKGSTAYLTSHLLQRLGFKTGLTISPHLLDLRERVQIQNRLISQRKFVYYLNELLPYINKMKSTQFGPPTYFEVLTGLAFYAFWEEKVDYAVIETGLGGLYDATNSVDSPNKLAVITRIGHDHTWILGKTLKEIARQKSGIIQKGNPVFTLWQRQSVREVVEEVSYEKKARLFYVKKGATIPKADGSLLARYSKVRVTEDKTVFDFQSASCKIPNLEVGLIGLHQAENASLALAAVLFLSQRDNFQIDFKKARQALKSAYFPGRLEICKLKGKTLVLDGAHNPQKMVSLIKTLKKIWPEQKFNFLIAVKKGKAYHQMLKYVVPLAKRIIVTEFQISGQDLTHRSEKAQNLEKALIRLSFKNYQVITDAKRALQTALSFQESQKGHPKKSRSVKTRLVITGSLYLLSQIYPSLTYRIVNR